VVMQSPALRGHGCAALMAQRAPPKADTAMKKAHSPPTVCVA